MKAVVQPTPAPLAAMIPRLRAAYDDMVRHQAAAVNQALYLGALLIEAKGLVGHGDFISYRRAAIPGLSDDRAERYMRAAEATLKQVELPAIDLPISEVLSRPADELPATARAAQQLLFDFTRDKTIKDCLAGVVVDGEEPHRITRAANGKKLGGTKGEDRKDFPKFIGEKLSDISSHLKGWSKFIPSQIEAIKIKFDSFIAKCPTGLLTWLRERINTELKTR